MTLVRSEVTTVLSGRKVKHHLVASLLLPDLRRPFPIPEGRLRYLAFALHYTLQRTGGEAVRQSLTDDKSVVERNPT